MKAQCNMGRAYFDGKGTDKNVTLAFEWWNKAAEQGGTEAKRCIGKALAALAQKWCKEAADEGDAEAKQALHSRLSSLGKATGRADQVLSSSS